MSSLPSLMANAGNTGGIHEIVTGAGLIIMIGSLIAVLLVRPKSGRIFCWISATAGIGCFVVGSVLLAPHCSSSNPRNAWASLKTIATAQADFRTYDRDEDGKPNFWRKDIAGLYALQSKEGLAIKLIDISVAGADDRPRTEIKDILRAPKAGYWYRTLRFVGEKEPSPDRFAACAFPDNPKAGRWTFIISHKAIVYRKAGVLRDIEVFPDDPLKEGWTKLD